MLGDVESRVTPTAWSYLCLVDLDFPFSPRLLGWYFSGTARTVDLAVGRQRAYLTTHEEGVRVVDLRSLAEVGGLATPLPVERVAAVADQVVVTAEHPQRPAPGMPLTTTLHLVDATAAAEPVELGALAIPGVAIGLAARAGAAFVLGQASPDDDQPATLRAVDVSRPESPVERSALGLSLHSGRDLALAGDLALVVTDVLDIVDVSDPAQMRILASFATGGDLRLVDATAGRAVLLARLEGGRLRFMLHVVDLSDPVRPLELGQLELDGVWAEDLALRGRYAFVVGGEPSWPDELRVVDLADPAHPVEREPFPLPGVPLTIEVAGRLGLVTTRDASLLVLDLGDPTRPQLLASYLSPAAWSGGWTFAGMAVVGSRLYLAEEGGGLGILDLVPCTEELPVFHGNPTVVEVE